MIALATLSTKQKAIDGEARRQSNEWPKRMGQTVCIRGESGWLESPLRRQARLDRVLKDYVIRRVKRAANQA